MGFFKRLHSEPSATDSGFRAKRAIISGAAVLGAVGFSRAAMSAVPPIAGGSPKANSSVVNLIDLVSDLTVDMAPILNALLLQYAGTGKTIQIHNLGSPYLLNTSLTYQSGVNLTGIGLPTFKANGSIGKLLIGTSLSSFSISNIILDSNNLGTGSHNPFLFTDCSNFELIKVTTQNTPSYNRIEGNSFDWTVSRLKCINHSVLHGLQIKSTLDGSGNIIFAPYDWEVDGVIGIDVAGTLVYPHSGAYSGRVTNVTKRRGTANIGGGEALGINYLCHDITFDNIKCFDGADNGVSLSGYNLTGGSILSVRCAHAGLYIYGNHNTIASLTAVDCGQQFTADASIWAGLQFASGFGGLCFNNTVAAVTAYNTPANTTQAYGVFFSAGAYTQWVASTSVTTGAYIYNGTNLYVYATSGTSGSSGPTHTTGTVADGTASLTFVSTFVTTTQAQLNTVGALNLFNHRITDYNDATGQSNSVHARNAWYDDFWQYENGDIMAHGANRRIRRLGTFWASGEAVTYGVQRNRTGRIYAVTNVGGTCSVAPTHTSGTVTGADSVAWTFVQAEDSIRNMEVQGSDTIFGTRVGIISPASPTVQVKYLVSHVAPEGVVTAPAGSLCTVSPDGSATSTLYLKGSGTGATNWKLVTTA